MMGKLKHIVFLIACALLVASCGKTSNNSSGGTITATIDGKPWSFSNVSVTFNKATQLDISINGSASGAILNIDLKPFSGRGTYPVSSSNGAYFEQNGVLHQGISGQITITDSYSNGQNQTIIKGTFNFLTDDNKSIQNGVFEAALELN